MDQIRYLLNIVTRRMEMTRFLWWVHAIGIGFAGMALLLMIMNRLPGEAFVPWMWVGPTLAVVTLLIAVVVWMRRRPTEKQVALIVDDRLDLREKLTTALHCEKRTDPFAQAAVQDAVRTASDARTVERARRRFGVQAPGGWWVSPLLIFLTMMAGWLPQMDVFAEEPIDERQVKAVTAEVQDSVETLVKTLKENDALRKELGDLEGLDASARNADPLRTPEEVKRDAIRKVTDLNRKLEDILNGEKSKTEEAMAKALKQLKLENEDGPARELADAMSKGDFGKAQEALKKMMDKMQKGEMSKAELDQLAQQMEDMAKQLQQLAQQQKALEDALKQAGLDPQLANNPQALQQALQNNQNLNQQQKQQLQQQAQAQQQANQAMQQMAKACQGMCQAAGQMGQGGQGQGQMQAAAGQLGQQLSQMEQAQMMLQQAQAMANMCQGSCQSIGQNLAMQSRGGMGGNGQGQGGNAPVAPTPYKTKLEKANIKSTQGDIIARQVIFDGPVIKGESVAKARDIIAEQTSGFDEALVEDRVPKPIEKAQQHYFGELERIVEAVRDERGAAPAPAEPAEAGEGQ